MPQRSLNGISKHSPRVYLSLREFSDAEVRIIGSLVGHTIAEVERELIRETLTQYDGSRTRAAMVLDISIRSLRDKIHEYRANGLTVANPAPPN